MENGAQHQLRIEEETLSTTVSAVNSIRDSELRNTPKTPEKPDYKKARTPYKLPVPGFLYRLTLRVFSFLARKLFRYRLTGVENIPKNGGAILACNHVSYLDMGFICPLVEKTRYIYTLAKAELYSNRIVAWIMRKWCVLPIKRGCRDAEGFCAALECLKSGNLLFMFPEGTNVEEKKRFHTGVARMAIETRSPVVPIATSGLERFPGWQHIIPLLGATINVRCGKALTPPEIPGDTPEAERLRIIKEFTFRIFGEIEILKDVPNQQTLKKIRAELEELKLQKESKQELNAQEVPKLMVD
ncbi:MAG: lysophospholipid acyltransferase family protein [Thermoplasmata archaeon]